MRLKIRHNAEIAHRLSLAPDDSKCRQIHGHGLQIELVLLTREGANGMAVNSAREVLEFGDMKKKFREHIDTKYDHHLILNKDDPWAQHLPFVDAPDQRLLPGLVTVPGDPTTENIAKWIAEWGCTTFKCDLVCRVEESKTNGAEVMYLWNSFVATMAGGAL